MNSPDQFFPVSKIQIFYIQMLTPLTISYTIKLICCRCKHYAGRLQQLFQSAVLKVAVQHQQEKGEGMYRTLFLILSGLWLTSCVIVPMAQSHITVTSGVFS
jgi:hypothetical protein